jgi:PAS domain S-box-containing protein
LGMLHMLELEQIIERNDVPSDVKQVLKELKKKYFSDLNKKDDFVLLKKDNDIKYYTLFDLSPDGIVLIDPQTGKFIEFNSTACQQLEYTNEEFSNLTIHDLEKSREAESRINKILKDGKDLFITKLMTKKGKIQDVALYAKRVELNRQPVIFSILRDITDQTTADIRLKFKASLLNELSDAVIFTDLDNRILRWNPAAEEIYGWTEEQALGKTVMELLQTQFSGMRLEDVMKSFNDKGLWRGETIQKKKDGASIDVYESVTLIKDNVGNPIAAIAINRDITEQKKIEEELKRKTNDLFNRVKELNCLYNLSNLLSERAESIEELFQKTVELLPAGWQYPDATCVRLAIFDKKYISNNFQETQWKQSTQIFALGRKIGNIEIFFTEEKPEKDEGPFLREERELITTVAKELSRFMERNVAEKDLLWEATVNAGLTELSKAAISPLSVEELSNLVLNTGKALTTSQFGYVGYIDPQTGYLVSSTLTKDIWDICQVPSDQKKTYFTEFKGLYGWVLREKKSILTNDAKNDPRSIGTPKGHISISKFLSAPALFKKKLVGQVSLANPVKNYSRRDLKFVQRLADIYALAIERMWTEKALRESEEKFKNITELTKEIIIRLSKDGKFTYINGTGLDFFGKSSDQLLNTKFSDFVHRNEINKYNNFLATIMELKSHVEDFDITLHFSTGNRIIKWNAAPILESNNVIGIQASGRDVTELQEELIEKNKLAAVGTLAAGVAHELNTPLANIELTSEYLINILENEKAIDAEIFNNELKDIKKEVKYCAKIVTELLQFSRKIHIIQSEIDINSLFLEIMDSPSFKAKIEEKKIKLEVKTDINLHIKGDQMLILQVFQNILDNSFDSLEKIKNPSIKIFADQNNNMVRIRVIDNGIGIRKEDLPHIFEPFFTKKIAKKGIGLGLSICRGIIDKHEGTIKINSIYGRGTEVIVHLPK